MDYKRNIRTKLDDAIKMHPAVTVVGARGVGKTRLVSEIAEEKKYAYCNLEEVRHVIAAQDDPARFLARLPKPVVLDALHRAPSLLPALKEDIAKNPVRGNYLCTSSSDPQHDQRLEMLSDISHVIPLHSFSQGELLHRKEHFIDTLFDANGLESDDNLMLPFDLVQFLRGGFVQTHAMKPRERDLWFNRYALNMIHHDISLQMQPEDHMLFVRLLHTLAQHSAQPINIAQISRKSGIPITTLNRHLAVLKNIHLYAEQGAWDGNGSIKKATKAPQAYLHDVGFAAWLQGADIYANDMYGDEESGLLKHAVFNELNKQASWNDTSVKLFHMRTMNGHEVDIFLERADGKIVGVQVKDNSHVTAQDTKGLLYAKEQLGQRWHRGVILHPGQQAVPLGNRMWLLPFSAMWSYSKPGRA